MCIHLTDHYLDDRNTSFLISVNIWHRMHCWYVSKLSVSLASDGITDIRRVLRYPSVSLISISIIDIHGHGFHCCCDTIVEHVSTRGEGLYFTHSG